jgi:uncharacterized membrane protein YkoI
LVVAVAAWQGARAAPLLLAGADADEARELAVRGEIMELDDLLKKVHRLHPGRIIEAELDNERGRYIYEIEMVDADGKVWELDVDARNGDVLKRELEED